MPQGGLRPLAAATTSAASATLVAATLVAATLATAALAAAALAAAALAASTLAASTLAASTLVASTLVASTLVASTLATLASALAFGLSLLLALLAPLLALLLLLLSGFGLLLPICRLLLKSLCLGALTLGFQLVSVFGQPLVDLRSGQSAPLLNLVGVPLLLTLQDDQVPAARVAGHLGRVFSASGFGVCAGGCGRGLESRSAKRQPAEAY